MNGNDITTPSPELEKVLAKQKELQKELEELRYIKKVSGKLVDDLDREKDKLEEAKARNEAILASIGDGVIATDDAERVIFMNPEAERILGLKAKSVLGKYWHEVQTVEDEEGTRIQKTRRLIHRVLQSSATKTSSHHDTHYYVRKDGTRFPVSVTASPVILKRKVVGVIEIFRDITEEKTIDRAKSEFVSIASHQLYTPLSSLRWYTEMLMDGSAGEIPPEPKKLVEVVAQTTLRMIELVAALLNVSRIDLGTFAVEPSPTDLGELAKAAQAEQRAQSETRNISVEVRSDPNLPRINIDPKLMRIVFDNLLSNAIKYTPAGGRVSLTMKQGEGQYIKSALIAVSDTGCGIPENERAKIFTKLFRASNAVKNVMDGTGLGLYTVKAIVERFQGTVWFESEENKGSVFFAAIPLSGIKGRAGGKALLRGG